MKAKLTKEQRQEKRFIKQNEKEFRAWQRKIVKKLKKSVMTKAIRLELIADLDHCNNIDLIHYLATAAEFTSDHSYIGTINKWLELETITFNYAFELVYKVGNMENITKLITLQHNKIDLEKEILG
jgi:hypothetical protein